MHEPVSLDPADVPRYTRRPLPPYRYIPFQGSATRPHPRNDPEGHAFDAEEEYVAEFSPAIWAGCEPYLYGIDLFNHGYWWEAHEAWEAVWHAAGGRETRCGRFVQGLIQLAAAMLKRETGIPGGAVALTAAACEKLAAAEGIYLGIEVATLLEAVRRDPQGRGGVFPRIVLHFPKDTG